MRTRCSFTTVTQVAYDTTKASVCDVLELALLCFVAMYIHCIATECKSSIVNVLEWMLDGIPLVVPHISHDSLASPLAYQAPCPSFLLSCVCRHIHTFECVYTWPVQYAHIHISWYAYVFECIIYNRNQCSCIVGWLGFKRFWSELKHLIKCELATCP